MGGNYALEPLHSCAFTPGPCEACTADFDASPAGICQRAVEKLGGSDHGLPQRLADSLAELLQLAADDMSDEHAIEQEFPERIPTARWAVVDWYGRGKPERYDWDAALATARAVLGEPDPNRPEVTSDARP